jgi:hypothetical protein
MGATIATPMVDGRPQDSSGFQFVAGYENLAMGIRAMGEDALSAGGWSVAITLACYATCLLFTPLHPHSQALAARETCTTPHSAGMRSKASFRPVFSCWHSSGLVWLCLNGRAYCRISSCNGDHALFLPAFCLPPRDVSAGSGILISWASTITVMTCCDHCGKECTLPFTCQHCGGKFCLDCRLPPNHDCTGIGSWNAKPRPAIGPNYSRDGGVTATGRIALETRRRPEKEMPDGLPYLKIMTFIMALVLLGLAWLGLTGY